MEMATVVVATISPPSSSSSSSEKYSSCATNTRCGFFFTKFLFNGDLDLSFRMSDTSQTYLLFQTLLLLFWLHSCMIWTKLTRTDAVFSRAAGAILYCAGFWIFRYAEKIPKNKIKNQRSGSFWETKEGPQ